MKESTSIKPIGNAADAEILTATLWMEARGEPDDGIQAVANVIVNRYLSKKWYSRIGLIRSIKNTCLKDRQFSCWNKGDQKDTKLPTANKNSPAWKKCESFAKLACAGGLPDIVYGADHYFTTSITPPTWARYMSLIRTIGHHRFYRDDT